MCRTVSEGRWTALEITPSSEEAGSGRLSYTRMKVGLLGDKVRRGRSERFLDLAVDLRAVEAMHDPLSSPKTFPCLKLASN